jgi:hypothetical protein
VKELLIVSPGACEGFDDHVENENYGFLQVNVYGDFDRRVPLFCQGRQEMIERYGANGRPTHCLIRPSDTDVFDPHECNGQIVHVSLCSLEPTPPSPLLHPQPVNRSAYTLR